MKQQTNSSRAKAGSTLAHANTPPKLKRQSSAVDPFTGNFRSSLGPCELKVSLGAAWYETKLQHVFRDH